MSKFVAINVDNGATQLVDDTAYVTGNFLYSEYACKDDSDVILYSGRLCKLIQAIRERVGPIRINSAFRTPSHNAAVGGASASKHLFGIAVDLKIPTSHTPDSFAKVILSVTGSEVGLGFYKTFIHLDIRGYEARWDNR